MKIFDHKCHNVMNIRACFTLHSLDFGAMLNRQ